MGPAYQKGVPLLGVPGITLDFWNLCEAFVPESPETWKVAKKGASEVQEWTPVRETLTKTLVLHLFKMTFFAVFQPSYISKSKVVACYLRVYCV